MYDWNKLFVCYFMEHEEWSFVFFIFTPNNNNNSNRFFGVVWNMEGPLRYSTITVPTYVLLCPLLQYKDNKRYMYVELRNGLAYVPVWYIQQ